MGKYALIKAGKVVNLIVWDGPDASPMEFEKGISAVEVDDGTAVDMGYTFTKDRFAAPPLTEEERESQAEAAKNANAVMKDALMSEAGLQINILQDAVDLEMATDAEAALLPRWKKYRVLLSRIEPQSAEQISWPEKPE
ncbi:MULTISPECIES: tail fiber assembly protein [unclassified Pantoea]|uniref:tail fiber assembly protein n=1 Tax=unclassified Pantoea TaxID=2630326 RepID=UPI001CC1F7D2|nr:MULTISPECIES: tail fiber assembly protein [unclassified Pantoea]